MNKKDVANGFRATIEEMAELHERKIEEYGIDRYRDVAQNTTEAAVMLNSDLYRKFIRLRQQLLYNPLSGVEPDWESVREGCIDLANYSVMGVQIADLVASKGREPEHWYLETLKVTPPRQMPAPMPAPFPVEQIAIMGRENLIKALHFLGATEWHHDAVRTLALVNGKGLVEQEAHLAFNYQLIPGKELEIIQYTYGPNWLQQAGVTEGLSHLGLHVPDIEEATQQLGKWLDHIPPIAQDAVTVSHTNPNIKDTRRYRYRIFNTRDVMGFDLKFIQRHMVVPGTDHIVWPAPFGKIHLGDF